MKKKILLLDVMSTLVYDPFFLDLPKAFGMSLQELMKNKNRTAWPAFERNEITEQQFFAQYFGEAGPVDGKKMKDCMQSNYRYLEGIEALLEELKRRQIPMYALSNYPHWYKMIEDKLSLSTYLEWEFVSCKTGVRKPDPRAYLYPAEVLGVAPEHCIFVDDMGKNCKAAAAVGMTAIQFEGAEHLRASLIEQGVL